MKKVIKSNLDIIISSILFGIISSMYFWAPQIFPQIQVNTFYAVTSPILTVVGLLLVYRLNEKLMNPRLKLRLDFYKLERSLRIFAKVENAPRRETARDAKAIITIKKIEQGNEKPLEWGDLILEEKLKDDDSPLVPYESVKIEGELIPWMVPETSYQSFGLHRILLKHVANIAPGQKNRAPIFDILSDGEGYYLRVFSEYGAEKELIEEWYGTPPKIPVKKKVRIIRCALRPGTYKFYITITANKAHPVIGVLQVDTRDGKLYFYRPHKREYDLKTLLKD